jgi:peptide/nickel transport system substrate-binding protein
VTVGLATPAIGPIAVGTWAYNPDLQGLDFDLAEARKELDASGYPDGAEIEMITINTSYYEQQAELVKQMLTEIGLTLNVVPVAVAELTNRTFVLRDVSMQLAGFSLRADPDGTISETLRSDGFYNPGRRENTELDTLIDNARQTYDQEERKGFYDQIQQIAIDEVYDWFFFYGRGYTAAQKHVLNLEQYYGGEAKPRWANLAREA